MEAIKQVIPIFSTVIHLIFLGMSELAFAKADYLLATLPCLIKMGYLLIQQAANSWKELMEFSRQYY